MKAPIRFKFFGWLVFFMLFSFLLNYSLDYFFDVYFGHLYESEDYREGLHEFLFYFAGNILFLPIVLVFGWIVAKRMLKPITVITNTAQEIIDGQTSARVHSSMPNDELGLLAGTINRAFDRYDEMIDQLRRFGSNTAHQLRTPLAAIRSKGEICLTKDRSPEEYRRVLHDIMERSYQLSILIEKLLTLSKLEAVSWSEQFSAVDFVRILRETTNEFEPLLDEKGIVLSVSGLTTCYMSGDPALLEQMVANLLDNAIRHTPVNGEISIDVNSKKSSGRMTCTIADSGPGIRDEIRKYIFERFNQGDYPDHCGVGLGLAIVAEIVRIHGGQIAVKNNGDRGAVFAVDFPCMERSSGDDPA